MICPLFLSSTLLAAFLQFYSSHFQYPHFEAVQKIIVGYNTIITNNFHNLSPNPMQVIPDPTHCLTSDTYKIYHPDIVLKEYNIIRDKSRCLVRQTIKHNFYDMVPLTYINKSKELQPSYKLPKIASIMFTNTDVLFKDFKVGQTSMCLFQKINQMVGRSAISQKDKLLNNQILYLEAMRQQNKSQQCIDEATYLPPTYRLYKVTECEEFFKQVNSEEYQDKFEKEGPQYILKKGSEVHRGRGIDMLLPEKLAEIKEKYKDGAACNSIKGLQMAQRYISNPLLYKQHKLEFRFYLYLASTYPLIVYVYHRPLIKRCASPFDKFSLEKSSHVCNTAIVKEKMNKTSSEEYDIEDEEFFIDWNLDGLQEILLKQGKLSNDRWLEDVLYPNVYRSVIHVMRSTQGTFYPDSKFSQFLAMDFFLTDDFKINVLEVNYNPQILNVTEDRILRNEKMMKLQDTLEIQMKYVRSRYVRIRKLVLSIIEKYNANQNDLQELILNTQDDLIKAYKDRLENEFAIDESNLYVKVIDENYEGVDKYNGLVKEECLI